MLLSNIITTESDYKPESCREFVLYREVALPVEYTE